jgi:DNA replication protein DnaC
MTSSNATAELKRALLGLGLRGTAEQLDDQLARATRQRSSPVQFLEELVRVETQDRARRSLESRRQRSRIGDYKPIIDFDRAWPKRLDRNLLDRILALHFLGEGASVILMGPHGLGKMMILKNMAEAAVLRGSSVLFVTASQLINDLAAQESTRALERRLKHYTRFAPLCVDELGYLAYENRAADLLFEVVNRRYAARRSIALSTNLPFSQWTTVFPNATCTVALVDRLTHRADILAIEGKSWRRKEADERGGVAHND